MAYLATASQVLKYWFTSQGSKSNVTLFIQLTRDSFIDFQIRQQYNSLQYKVHIHCVRSLLVRLLLVFFIQKKSIMIADFRGNTYMCSCFVFKAAEQVVDGLYLSVNTWIKFYYFYDECLLSRFHDKQCGYT
jgi:hypothetical protein